VVSHNEGLLRRTIENLLATLPANSEVVVVDDHSTDGSSDFLRNSRRVKLVSPPQRCGVSLARTFGAAHATGEVIVFSDAHVEAEPHWAPALCEVLADPRVGMAGPCITDLHDLSRRGYGMKISDDLVPSWLPQKGKEPYPVPILCGAFLALRKDVLQQCGGFDPGMDQWGSEDVELSLRLWTLGYECVVTPSAVVAHLFRERHPYRVDADVVEFNRLRAGFVHFDEPRLSRFMTTFPSTPEFQSVAARLTEDSTLSWRQRIRERRRFDAEWFFGTLSAAF